MATLRGKKRERLLDKYKRSCAVCQTPLLVGQLHHVIFQSQGGTDDEDNLVPLCGTCHNNFPHSLYRDCSVDSLRTMCHGWRKYVETQRAIATATDWQAAARVFLNDDARGAVGLYGFYAHAVHAGDMIFKTANPRDDRADADVLLRYELLVSVLDSAIYLGQDARYTVLLEAVERRMNLSDVDPVKVNYGLFVHARVAAEEGNVAAEQEFLAEYRESPTQMHEQAFRQVSLRLKLNMPECAGVSKLATPHTLGEKMAAYNIEAHSARLAAAVDGDEATIARLTAVFEQQKEIGHKRGMMYSAFKLSDLYLNMGNAEFAHHWMAVGSQFPRAGVSKEFDPLVLESRLECLRTGSG